MKFVAISLLFATVCVVDGRGKCEGKLAYRLQVQMKWLSRKEPNENIVGLLAVTHGEDFKLFEPNEELNPALEPFVEYGIAGPAVQWLLSGEFNVNLFGVMESGPAHGITTIFFDVTKYTSFISIMGVVKGRPDFFFGTTSPIDMCSDEREDGNFTRFYPGPSAKQHEYFAQYNASADKPEQEGNSTKKFKFGRFKMLQTQLITPTPSPSPSPSPTPTATPTPTPVVTSASELNSDTTLSGSQPNVAEEREFRSPNEAAGNASAKPACFPSYATVRLESGVLKRMEDVVVGDRVWVGGDSYSPVFMFTHKPDNNIARDSTIHEFLELMTTHGNITLTAGHYLAINGRMASAGSARTGDRLEMGSGESAEITSIRTVSGAGLYNPQTLHGSIVVDGMVASCYTEAVEQHAAHALLAPLRVLCATGGIVCRVLENGGGALTKLVTTRLL